MEIRWQISYKDHPLRENDVLQIGQPTVYMHTETQNHMHVGVSDHKHQKSV